VTRKDCPQCVEARRIVEHSARRYRVAIEYVDIESEPAEVQEKFRFDVPVVLVDGKRRFSGHVSAPLLEKVLKSRPT